MTFLLAGLLIATLLPIAAAAWAIRMGTSRDPRHRRAAPALAFAAVILTYFHPVVQEAVNELYLGPKLRRAQALVGQEIQQLVDRVGVPSSVVLDSAPPPERYSYLLYDSAPWTPLASVELLVPLTDDRKRISVMAHYVD